MRAPSEDVLGKDRDGENTILEIAGLFSKINKEIDKINGMVEKRVHDREDEFLTAYRTQMAKIKEELYQIKNAESARQYRAANLQLKDQIGKLKGEIVSIFARLEERSKESDELRLDLDNEKQANRHLQG